MTFIIGFIVLILVIVLKQYDISEIENLIYFKKLSPQEIQALSNNKIDNKKETSDSKKSKKHISENENTETSQEVSSCDVSSDSSSLTETRKSLLSSSEFIPDIISEKEQKPDLNIYSDIEIYTPENL